MLLNIGSSTTNVRDQCIRRMVRNPLQLATLDVLTYSLNAQGQIIEELWLKTPWCGFIHGCAITTNFIVLFVWLFEASIERLKEGKQHWAWNYGRLATFIVTPQRLGNAAQYGWANGEYPIYSWKNWFMIMPSSFFPPEDGRIPYPETKADSVRGEFDLSKPTGTTVSDPVVILDLPSEFPKINERSLTTKHEWAFINAFIPENSHGSENIPQVLNGLAMHSNHTGDKAPCQESTALGCRARY